MTSASLQHIADRHDHDWSQWIAAHQAAPMLSVSLSTAHRMCREQWSASGQAIKAKAPSDRQSRWWLHRSVDACLWREASAPSPTLEAMGIGKGKADHARQRRECVRAFRRARSSEDRPGKIWRRDLIAQLRQTYPAIKISQARLYAWDKALRHEDDLSVLVDRRGGNVVAADARAWDYFTALYLDDNKPTVSECWRKTQLHAADQDMAWCAMRTCQDQIDNHIDPAKQAYHRDRQLYNSQYLPTLRQDAERFKAGRCWVYDHTTLDFEVRVGKRLFRPTLTTAMDWRTRKVVGWCLCENGNSDTILLATREGMLDHANMGGPEQVCFDNGRDFASAVFDGRTKQDKQRDRGRGRGRGRGRDERDFGQTDEGTFRGVMGELNIEVHFSIAYSPNGKARMERWYGYLHDVFCKSMPTYVGKDTASKPHGLADRRRDLKSVPTWDDVHGRLCEFVGAYNNRSDHQIADLSDSGLSLSPNQAMAAWCTHRRAYNPGALDLLLLHHSRPVRVGKRGVGITINGQVECYGLMQSELGSYQGSRRQVLASYDPRDLRTINVFDAQTRELICIASSNEYGGQDGPVGRQMISAFQRRVREHHRHLKAVHLEGVLPNRSSLELMAERGDLASSPEPVTRSIRPVQTRFDESAKDVQRHELKAAAGAEHNMPDGPNKAKLKEAMDKRKVRGTIDLTQFLDPSQASPVDESGPDDLEITDTAPLMRIGSDVAQAIDVPDVAQAIDDHGGDDGDDDFDPMKMLRLAGGLDQ